MRNNTPTRICNDYRMSCVFDAITHLILEEENEYCVSWWIREWINIRTDMCITTSEVNYLANRMVKNGNLTKKSFKHGIHYSLTGLNSLPMQAR